MMGGCLQSKMRRGLSEKCCGVLKASQIETPLGPMLAIADEEFLHLLEFGDGRDLAHKVEKLSFKTKSNIFPGNTRLTQQITWELQEYFAGTLKRFKTPLYLLGSSFQQLVWSELLTVPYGQTKSYAEEAHAINKPTACRAVANANGANQIAIVIPCHRIINSNGGLGGYGGGVHRKKWLIEHEKRVVSAELNREGDIDLCVKGF